MVMNIDEMETIRSFAKDGYGSGVFNQSAFSRDFNNILTTKKMISRFLKTGALNERLLLNNVVLSLNAFGPKKTNLLFRMVCDDVQFSVAKAVLMFLRQYDFSVGDDVFPNRIIVDVFKHLSVRYNLDHL